MRQAIKLTGQVMLVEGAHVEFVRSVIKKIFRLVLVPKALVDVPAAARQVFVPFGHKSGRYTMFIGNFLYGGFK